MKTIHKINLIALLITLGLYVTIFFGMMAQFFLGIIQFFFMLRVTINYHECEEVRNHLNLYWSLTILVLSAIAMHVIFEFQIPQSTIIVGLFVIPMLLAIYAVYITWIASKIEINTKINQNES